MKFIARKKFLGETNIFKCNKCEADKNIQEDYSFIQLYEHWGLVSSVWKKKVFFQVFNRQTDRKKDQSRWEKINMTTMITFWG